MVKNNISIGGARIGFRNFTGKEGKFNPGGKRNFCVFLERDLAVRLEEDGWNVRWLEPRNADEENQAILSCAVSFGNKPPKIIMKTSNGNTQMDEESVSLLDWADIEHVDLILSPYNWDVQGRKGVKAYVKSMYVTIAEDEFEGNYINTPDSADNSMCEGCLNVNGSCDQCPKHN